MPFTNEDEMKAFLDEGKLGEFVTSRPALKKCLFFSQRETWNFRNKEEQNKWKIPGQINIANHFSPFKLFKICIVVESKNHDIFTVCRCNAYDSYNRKGR